MESQAIHIIQLLYGPALRPLAVIADKDEQTVVRELGFEMSGSDGIRMKWAYYLALMGLGLTKSTNHPMLLVFDEPDQQATEKQDVKSFLHAASKMAPRGQIIVAATTEKVSDFTAGLKEIGANIIDFEGYVLKRVSDG